MRPAALKRPKKQFYVRLVFETILPSETKAEAEIQARAIGKVIWRNHSGAIPIEFKTLDVWEDPNYPNEVTEMVEQEDRD